MEYSLSLYIFAVFFLAVVITGLYIIKVIKKTQVFLLLKVFILIEFYSFALTHIHEKFLCFNEINCQVWGTYFAKSAGFHLSGFFLFIVVAILLRKGFRPIEAKRFLPLTLISFLLITFASFQTYVKTNTQGIESRDFIVGIFAKDNISWSDIKSFGVKKTYVSTKTLYCRGWNTYIILKDGSPIELSSTVISGNLDFIRYLQYERNLPNENILPNQCWDPKS